MRNNDSKEPALRFDSYKFLFHRARLATFATQSALFSLTAMTRGVPLAGVNRTSSEYRRRTDLTPTRSSLRYNGLLDLEEPASQYHRATLCSATRRTFEVCGDLRAAEC